MIRWLSILLTCFFAGEALAQTVVVRSGEHDQFTRLVAEVPVGTDWTVSQIGRNVKLNFSGFEQSFDTNSVFKRISRDQIAEVESSLGMLNIKLACDCRVAAFLSEGRYVVIDVALPDVALPQAFVPFQNSQEKIAEDRNKVDTLALSASSIANQSTHPKNLATLPRTELTADAQRALSNMQTRLANELGSAASRGVLTPSLREVAIFPPSARVPQIGLSNVSSLTKNNEINRLPDNMRITNSLEMPPASDTGVASSTLMGVPCISNDVLNIADWADERPLHIQIGEARLHLYDELDRLDPDAAVDLAKIYLYFGFGAEARQILDLDSITAQKNKILLAVADIYEHGESVTDINLDLQLDCDSDVALWALLSTIKAPATTDISLENALHALNKLPAHLRRFLAPALSNQLLALGETDAAATAMRSVERLPNPLGSLATLAKAKVALKQGNTDVGVEHLSNVAKDNSAHSPEALIALVQTKLAANEPIEHETADLIAAYAKELNETPLGPALRHSHILALLKSGDFDLAFSTARKLGAFAANDDAVDLRLHLLRELTAAAEDIVFLEHIFAQTDQDIERLENGDQLALIERLLDLGFGQAAQELLSKMSDKSKGVARQLLVARTALSLRQPMRANAALIALDGRDIDILRAQAMTMAGDHSAASQLFSQSDSKDEAIEAAWLAEDASADYLSQSDTFGPVAALSNTSISTSAIAKGMLERGNNALDESSAARDSMARLLSSPELTIEPYTSP